MQLSDAQMLRCRCERAAVAENKLRRPCIADIVFSPSPLDGVLEYNVALHHAAVAGCRDDSTPVYLPKWYSVCLTGEETADCDGRCDVPDLVARLTRGSVVVWRTGIGVFASLVRRRGGKDRARQHRNHKQKVGRDLWTHRNASACTAVDCHRFQRIEHFNDSFPLKW